MSKGIKNLVFYLLMIALFGLLIYLIVRQGEFRQSERLEFMGTPAVPSNLSEGFEAFRQLFLQETGLPIAILLLQIIAILLICRLFGWLFKKMGQPTVMGEILAGIVLGPSVLGYFAPEISEFLFREESLTNINILSQFGLILFMFAIGMELDLGDVRKKLKQTILISHAGIIVPFFFGILTAYFVYDRYAAQSTPFLSFALFIGISMSITAFPVLARIIQERGLTKSHLGTLAIASAANDNITAWCLLAVVIAIAQAGSMLSAVFSILFSGIYLLVMFFFIRPILRVVGHIYDNKEVIDKGMVALMFLILITSSYFTQILGLHALFGAFIAGMIMPENMKFRKILTEKVEDVSLALFLPLFFVSTGLRTEINLLNTPELWGMCGIIILAAVAGKFGGAFFSSRFVGESWENSLYMGALMNTRGLMELIVLTIGYEMNILPPPIFVILVLMTLATAFMTAPLITFIHFCFRAHNKLQNEKMRLQTTGVFRMLLSFGRASNGQIMLDVAHQMFAGQTNELQITALHLTVGADVNPLHTDNFEEVSFGPILYGARKLGIPIKPRYEISNDAGMDIVRIVNEEKFDFLLVGSGISLSDQPSDVAANRFRTFFYNRYLRVIKAPESWFYPGALLKDKTEVFIENVSCAVGIFVNRNFLKATNVILIIASADDLFLLTYAQTLWKSTQGNISFVNKTSAAAPGIEDIRIALNHFTATIKQSVVLPNNDLTPELFDGYNFMLISYHTWNDVSEHRKEALQRMPSTLILNK
ncbi:MAG: cation:proton antiporter [Tannerellaceae bacterium]|jgi:Kef-type K+ transport system membrane component KefB|nr:cation:proton antiporter [Tannerellaceae bacterium]